MCPKDTDGMANRLDPDQSAFSLILIYTVCQDLSVQIFRIFTVHVVLMEPLHDKTNKMTYAPSEDSDQPGYPPSPISLRCPHEKSLGP